MPKYQIEITAIVEVEAENVMLAKKVSEDVRLIGQKSGSMYLRHWNKPSSYCVKITNFVMSNPKRVKNTLLREY